jgi:hypothetical protein
MDFDKYLGTYPMTHSSQWQGVSNFISSSVINRLDPLNHLILSEGKERILREREDPLQDGGDDVDKTLEALQK